MNEQGIIYRMDDSSTREEWLAKRSRGIGASEADVMCNKSRWHTQEELWELKTGKVKPKEPSEAMVRGTLLEEPVRNRFMETFAMDFEFEYHAYGMYYRTDYPMLYATLDLKVRAKHNVVRDFGNGQVLSLKEGEEAIVEIKNPAPRDFKTYQEWDHYPAHYRYQASQQMFCTGMRHQIMLVNITGEYQQTQPYDERIFVIHDEDLKEETAEIIATAAPFWAMVTNDKRPASVMELDKAQPDGTKKKDIIPFSAQVALGSITDNLAVAKKSVIEYAAQFKGLKFSDDQYKDAKALRARLNKDRDFINDRKKSVKAEWMKPYNIFENECKEMMDAIDDVNKPIDEQIKAYENKQRELKKVFVRDSIDRLIDLEYPELKDILDKTGGYTESESWYNSSTKTSEVQKQVRMELDLIKKDMLVLQSAKANKPDEVYTAMYTAYITSTRSIEASITAQKLAERTIEQRRIAEEQRKAQEARIAQERQNVPPKPVEPPVATQKPAEAVAPSAPRYITLRIEVAHTDRSKFPALVQYLKDNGFHCKTIQ